MLKKKVIKLTMSAITFIISIFILTNSQLNITGAVIGISASANSILNSLLGVLFIVSSIILFATAYSELESITLSSAIKKSSSILRLTQDAVRNKTIERELNHLVKELSKGNFEAGLGYPGHVGGTDVFYMRGRNGARVYYHKIGDNNYEIVAKSAKGRNQDQVMDNLRDMYGN